MIRKDLLGSTSGIAVSFIDNLRLERWREFVFIATTRKSNREDFRFFAERYLVWMREIAPEELETFFASFDARVEQVLRMVPQEPLQAFREQSIEDSVRVAEEYLR
jgi:hypothetical protein